jgi:hypothetical protein
MDEKTPDSTKSLLGELNSLSSLLDSAMGKANALDKKADAINNLIKTTNANNSSVDGTTSSTQEENNTPVKPQGWDNMKDSILESSLKIAEEELNKKVDTTKARTIKPKSKYSEQDWEDDPF